jgi:hypothetical protein
LVLSPAPARTLPSASRLTSVVPQSSLRREAVDNEVAAGISARAGARKASADRRWLDAYEALSQIDAQSASLAADLELLATAAFLAATRRSAIALGCGPIRSTSTRVTSAGRRVVLPGSGSIDSVPERSPRRSDVCRPP